MESDPYKVLIVARVKKYGAIKWFALQKLMDPVVLQSLADNISVQIIELQDTPMASVESDGKGFFQDYQSPRDYKSWNDNECA